MLNNYGDILTVDELCEVLRISENIAYRLIRENNIASFKIGRIYKIPKKAIENYICSESDQNL